MGGMMYIGYTKCICVRIIVIRIHPNLAKKKLSIMIVSSFLFIYSNLIATKIIKCLGTNDNDYTVNIIKDLFGNCSYKSICTFLYANADIVVNCCYNSLFYSSNF